MKLFFTILILITSEPLFAQPELVNKDYNFRVKQATQFIPKKIIGYTYDTITSRYTSIEVYLKSKKFIIDYVDKDSEEYTIKDKQSTYRNNRTFWCKYQGAWYTFTFVRIDDQVVHLNIESIEKKLSVSFLLKEN